MAALATLAESPLLANGGWWRGFLLSPAARAALAEEAARCHAAEAQVARIGWSPDEDVVRGNPARFLEWAPAGPRLRAFYAAPPLARFLGGITGLDWTPSGEQPSFSYYRRSGHHLGLHRDIDACDLAVISCIHEAGAPASGLAGALCLWPDRADEKLADIRHEPERGRVAVRLSPGESIVLLGGIVPHELVAVQDGHVRIVAPLCFRVA